MAQRVMLKKNGKVKGVAIKASGGSNPKNTVTVGNVTLKGGGNSSRKKGGGAKKRKRRKRK